MKEETHYGVCILLEDIIYTHYQENFSSLCSKINDLATRCKEKAKYRTYASDHY